MILNQDFASQPKILTFHYKQRKLLEDEDR